MLLGDGAPIALSQDGTRALYRTFDGAVLFADGGAEHLPVPVDLGARLTADGSAVVGTTLDHQSELVRWTPSGGVESLAALPTGGPWSVAALAPDGLAAAGWGYSPDGATSVPFRWTAAGGLSDLGPLPSGVSGARPLATSDDGSVVIGVTTVGHREHELFRWTEGDGFSILGPALYSPSGVHLLLSADGAAAAGTFGTSPNGGFRWIAAEQPEALLDGWSMAMDMSRDGSLVLGAAENGDGFVWNQGALTRFSDVLAARSIDTSGWLFDVPTRMSSDGKVIFGRALCGEVPVTYRLEL